jgi:hypothetical protein
MRHIYGLENRLINTSSVSDRYGSPADIKIKQNYLIRSVDVPNGIDWR